MDSLINSASGILPGLWGCTVILGQYSYIFIGMIMLSSMVVLVLPRFRWVVAALVVQYLAAFWFTTSILPVGLAAVKLLIGWMIVALLASETVTIEKSWDVNAALSSKLLMAVVLVIMWIVIFLAVPTIQSWLYVPSTLVLGGMVLLVGGIIQIGLSSQTARVCIGLLTFFSGFEIIYAALEQSVLVSGLLGLVNIGIGLAGLFLTMRTSNAPEVIP